MSSTGEAMTSTAMSPPAMIARGWPVTTRAHRRLAEAYGGTSGAVACTRARGAVIFVPANPISAGSSVMAIDTAMTTVPAAARPMTVRKGMLTTDRPVRAITTVSPAKMTADPAVAVARAAASAWSNPLDRFSRYRWRMNSA